jgi:conjugal transfer pilus assembly protein TraV
MSGLGGKERYACKAPVGAQCTSVSGVYANALHGMNDLPPAPLKQAATITPASTVPASNTTGLRTKPRVLRLWIAPWEDSDGDLHDASFVHVVVDTGHWLIDRVRPTPRSSLDAVTPPPTPASPAASAPSPSSEANVPSTPSGSPAANAWSGSDAASPER